MSARSLEPAAERLKLDGLLRLSALVVATSLLLAVLNMLSARNRLPVGRTAVAGLEAPLPRHLREAVGS